ncbi:MAG: hypothetical protein ACTHN7_11015 [Solirubrobacterales bacterium]
MRQLGIRLSSGALGGRVPLREGEDIDQLLRSSGAKPTKLVIAPAAQVFEVGENRYPFGVFTRGNEQVDDADVAMYFAGSPKGAVTGPLPAQVTSLHGRADFIHMGVYNDNDPGKGIRPQLRTYHLPTELWTFLIDRDGVIRDRIEGAFGVSELEQGMRMIVPG